MRTPNRLKAAIIAVAAASLLWLAYRVESRHHSPGVEAPEAALGVGGNP